MNKYLIIADKISVMLINSVNEEFGKNYLIRPRKNTSLDQVFGYLKKHNDNRVIVVGRGEKHINFYHSILNDSRFVNFTDRIYRRVFISLYPAQKSYVLRNLELAGAKIYTDSNTWIVIDGKFEAIANDLKNSSRGSK